MGIFHVIDRPLWQLSACDLADAIHSRMVTCTEATNAAIGRLRACNPHLNAVVDDLSDAALAEAAELDRTLARSGPVGPLHGVPVTIKENIDQKGYATPNGVTAFKDIIAPEDSPVVRNLKRAGAIVVGRTNTPEFSFRLTTDNELHGRTFNPWNDWASAGGSSGGASAAVMAGMCALAHGNDIAGSLRYPATATGATTIKPGFGRVPAYNPSATAERGLLAQLMSAQGIIAREVRDVRLAMRTLIGYDPRDPWQVPMPFDGPAPEGRVKIAFTRDSFEFDLHPAVDKALTAARDALIDAGYEVMEADPPLMQEVATEAARCLFGEIRALVEPDIRKYGSATINAIFDGYFEYFVPYEDKDLLLGLAKRAHYVRQWQLFLAEYPLVLTPFLLTPTYGWDADTKGASGVIGTGTYAHSINFLGLPAGNVPANYNDGLPVGVQIIGRRFREDMILDACEAIEGRVGLMCAKLFERG